MSCIFCDLIQGAAEVSVCYEDAEAIAFMDIQPVNAGHVLVVPRQHYESLLDVPPELGAHLFGVTMRLANAVKRVTRCEGMNLVVNSGVAAGQDVFHYHVHIIPRTKGDGFDIELPFAGSAMPDRTQLDMTAARILGAMQDPMRNGSAGMSGEPGARSGTRDAGRTTAPRGVPATGGSTEANAPSDEVSGRPPQASRNGDMERVTAIQVHREPAHTPAPAGRPALVRETSRVFSMAAAREGAHGELVQDFDGAA